MGTAASAMFSSCCCRTSVSSRHSSSTLLLAVTLNQSHLSPHLREMLPPGWSPHHAGLPLPCRNVCTRVAITIEVRDSSSCFVLIGGMTHAPSDPKRHIAAIGKHSRRLLSCSESSPSAPCSKYAVQQQRRSLGALHGRKSARTLGEGYCGSTGGQDRRRWPSQLGVAEIQPDFHKLRYCKRTGDRLANVPQ